MAFRRPLYLNIDLLLDMADYFEIDLPADAQITRRMVAQRSGRGAAKAHGLEFGGERGSSEDTTAVYSTSMRPVRALNGVVDDLLRHGELVDLVADPSSAISRSDVIQIEGEVTESPATEIGAMMSALLDVLISRPDASFEDLDEDTLRRLFTNDQPARLRVFDMDSDVPETAVCLAVHVEHLFGEATPDDLEGDLTVFGRIDKLVGQGRQLSLERHLLPGLNRATRRMLGTAMIEDMLKEFGDINDEPLDVSSINVDGPAMLLEPVAIY